MQRKGFGLIKIVMKGSERGPRGPYFAGPLRQKEINKIMIEKKKFDLLKMFQNNIFQVDS